MLDTLRRAGVPLAVFNASGAVWDGPVGVPFLDARTRLAAGLAQAVERATVIQPSSADMENLAESWVADRVWRAGELAQPGPADASLGWVALDDVAATIVGELASPGASGGRVAVSGPEELTGHQAAHALQEALGRPVRWTTVPFEEHLGRIAAHLGRPYADALAKPLARCVPFVVA